MRDCEFTVKLAITTGRIFLLKILAFNESYIRWEGFEICEINVNELRKWSKISINRTSEASPTLGCSIEISRDIYVSVGRSVGRLVCRSVGQSVSRSVGMSVVSKKCIGGITLPKRAHAQSQIWVVKTDL